MKAKHVIFGLLLLAACAKQPTMPPPQEDVLYQVEVFFSKKPDSALQILDTLDVDVLSKKERAHYCLLRVQVRDALFLYDDETDSLLQVAENYFVGGKDKWFEAKTYDALARIAFKMGKGIQYKLDWQQKAIESIEQCQNIDERFLRFQPHPTTEQEWLDAYKYRLHWRLGMTYLDSGYQNEGFHHLKLADHYFLEAQDYDMRSKTAYMLGNAYLTQLKYDSCVMYYRYGLEASEQAENKELCANYYCSMSLHYRYRFEQQDYEDEEKGRQLLQKSIEECHRGLALYEGSLFRYKDGLYNDLTKSHFLLQQYDSCLYYSEKLLAFYEEHHFNMVPNNWNSNIYWRMYQSHEALGHAEEALKYAHLYFEMKQAIEDQPQAVEQVKNEYDKKLEIMQLQHEQQVKRYRLYLLLAISLVTLLVVMWLGNRYRKNKEIETLRQEEAYRKLQAEFEAASQQAQQAQQALQQRVMAIYKTGQEDRLERILAEFTAAYPNAMEKLQAAHPNLTESERNIVVLSFLGFRTKEEAEILHLSLNTVEKYRTNIRKKASQDPISDLIR